MIDNENNSQESINSVQRAEKNLLEKCCKKMLLAATSTLALTNLYRQKIAFAGNSLIASDLLNVHTMNALMANIARQPFLLLRSFISLYDLNKISAHVSSSSLALLLVPGRFAAFLSIGRRL